MDSLNYLLLVNFYLLMFYAFYSAVLRNETFFKLNRIYLISGVVLSFLIPIMQSEWVKSFFITQQVTETISYVINSPVFIVKAEKETLTSSQIILMIYLAGASLFLVRFLFRLSKVRQAFSTSLENQAFSFFDKIKIDPSLPHHNIILNHELVHIKQWHSADIIFFELIAIINWFNPIVYLYKKAIKYIHEFTADEAAAANEYDKTAYAMLIMSRTFGVSTHEFTNSFFNHSLLKRRIIMLNKTKSKKIAILKYALSAPLFGLMLIFSSATLKQKMENSIITSTEGVRKITSSILLHKEITSPIKKSHINIEPTVFENRIKLIPLDREILDTVFSSSQIDILPEFPGGFNEFSLYLERSLNYTEEVQKSKFEGKMYLSFVVEKDGTLADVKVIVGLGSSYDKEAIRVLKASPKWNPGLKNGEPVKVRYTLPILFKLEKEKKKVLGDTIINGVLYMR